MPIAAAIPAIIGAAGGIGGALINRSSANKANSQANALLPPGLDQTGLLNFINKQSGTADVLQSLGQGSVDQGASALTGPLSYFSSILGGDRNAIMEAMAPEVAAVNAQFQAPLQQAQLTGRGGALATDLEASRQSGITNAILSARPAAADRLTGIAQNLMNLGTQQIMGGGQVRGNATRDILDYNSIIRGIQAQTRMDNAGMWGSLGTALGPILGSLLGGVFGGGGGSKPTATPPFNGNVFGT